MSEAIADRVAPTDAPNAPPNSAKPNRASPLQSKMRLGVRAGPTTLLSRANNRAAAR